MSEKLTAIKIFLQVMALPIATDRQVLLETRCGNDSVLRKRVERLLAMAMNDAEDNSLDVIVDALGLEATTIESDPNTSYEVEAELRPKESKLSQTGQYKLL
jgi:hypothetical protein